MNLTTLSAARSALWQYGPNPVSYASSTSAQKTAWDARANRVVERYLGMMKPSHTMRRCNVPIYDSAITLPRHLQSLLGLKLVNAENCPCHPLAIYSRFHEFSQVGAGGGCCSSGVYPLSETVQTFRDPSAGFRLRAKSTTGAAGSFTLIGGRDTDWDEYFDSVTLAISDGTTTTSREWNSMPRIVKPVTTPGVELYSVDDDDEETLIAIYAPAETNPAYQRYRVPECGSAVAALVLSRLTYVEATADTDILYPGNLGALQMGLQALNYEDRNDFERSEDYWQRGLRIIDMNKTEFEGDAQIPSINAVPGFGASAVPNVI